MKMHIQTVSALLLVLVALLIPLHAYAVEEVDTVEALPETVMEEVVEPQPDLTPDSTTEVSYQERLEDIQVLLMYLCGMAIFWTFIGCGKLLYRFFNMFF